MSGERLGEAIIERALDPGHVLRLAQGDFAAVFTAYEEHARRWELPRDDIARAYILPGLAALGLHLALLKNDQTVGVTLNIVSPALNVFLTGDAGAHTFTGRLFLEDVRTAGSNRMYVQSFRPQSGVSQSTLDVPTNDVLGMFEEYYSRSEQFPARFLQLSPTRFGMIEALPDGGHERLEALAKDELPALFDGPRDMVFQHRFHFRCGCSPVKIARALRQMFTGRDAELFHGDPGVEAFCPRCGARWWIERSAYDAVVLDD